MSGGPAPDDVEPLVELVRQQLGSEVREVEPLTPGLGLRRFYRLRLAGGDPDRLIGRVETREDPQRRPAGTPPEPPLEPLLGYLASQGLPVPRRLGGDAAGGIDLLEDLGDDSLQRIAPRAGADERRALYAEACDLVPRLQAVPPRADVPAFGRRMDAQLIRYKAEFFCRHGFGASATDLEQEVIHEAFQLVAEECEAAPQRLAHRDFQSANLHRVYRDSRPRLFMIDLQGALMAPPEYDLVCLLRDSYVELPEEEVGTHLQRIRPALPDAPDAATFAHRFALLTLSRKAKDYALYRYALRERGDARFADYAPAAARALRLASGRVAASDLRLERLADLLAARLGST